MATVLLSTALANAMADAATALLDAGAGAGTIKLYSGALPADGDTDPAGTLLATVTLAKPSFPGAAASGVDAMAAVASVTIGATGTAAVAIFEDSAGNNGWTGDVTATGGGGMLELDSVALSAGASLQITGFNFTVPTS